MKIYICKNCGKLTESEAATAENLFCSTCGAPLAESKSEDKEVQPHSTSPPPGQPIPRVAVAPPPRPAMPPAEPAETEETSVSPHEEAEPEPLAEPESISSGNAPSSQGTSEQVAVPVDSPDASPSGGRSQIAPHIAGPNAPQDQGSDDSAIQVMEVYEDKNLVVCPECSYGCNPSWDKCPICGTQIAGNPDLQNITDADFSFSEDSLKQKLIPCPKCQYSCDPNWDACPICQTKLPSPEESND